MSETASGFVRITTLILLTAAFAMVWRGDQQVQQQFIIARKAAAERVEILAHRSAHREAARQMTEMSRTAEPGLQPTAAPAEQSRIVRVEIEMELPAGITAGTYQVVDQSGPMQKIRITGAPGNLHDQDLYVLNRQDGERRYFIRISDGLAGAPTQTASAPLPVQQ